MEPIKVSVEVKIDFSESTKGFINELVKAVTNGTSAPAISAAPAKPAAPAAPAAPTTGHTPSAAAPAAPAAKEPADSPAPAKPAAAAVTIDEVRQALAAKVNSHREEIKAKLSEFGAPSVTRLDPSHYMDMLIFLNSLS